MLGIALLGLTVSFADVCSRDVSAATPGQGKRHGRALYCKSFALPREG